MNNILKDLDNNKIWHSFLEYKLEKGVLFPAEIEKLKNYIENQKYKDKVDRLNNREYCFSIPEKNFINKLGTNKKRVIYTFKEDENYILKCISYLLHRYDDIFAPNLYSFRKNYGARDAINCLSKIKNKFAYKVDIQNYFNSINIEILTNKLKKIIDDEEILWFFNCILNEDKCIFNNETIIEKRGAMAGTPTSAFFANIYLMDLDQYFFNNNITYARYSDDIIIFADTIDELENYIRFLKGFLSNNLLKINTKKEQIFTPSEPWEFLGIKCFNNTIDLSSSTVRKIKGKIRRKCRALYRWTKKKNLDCTKGIKATIRIFNNKFYNTYRNNELTWSKWFFPIITTDKSLKIVDSYFQENLRYIASGRHTKKNYKIITYQDLKKCGYKPLTSAFWEFKTNSQKP